MNTEKSEKKSKQPKSQELKKEDIYPFLDDYYKSIGRTETPNYREYSLAELKKCLTLFKINLTKE